MPDAIKTWEPVPISERYTSLDLLRGFALFGVLLVNLLYFFRESLFEFGVADEPERERRSLRCETWAKR